MGYKRKGTTGEVPLPKRLQKSTTRDGSTGKQQPLCSCVRRKASSNGVNDRSHR